MVRRRGFLKSAVLRVVLAAGVVLTVLLFSSIGPAEVSPADSAWSFTAAEAIGALDEVLWRPASLGAAPSARPGPGEHVFDDCCGIGASARSTARLVGRDGYVRGVDLSAALTAVARERGAYEGLHWAAVTAQVVEVQHRYQEILTQRDVTHIDATTLVGIGKVAP